jgi:hypothetical protein
MLYKKMYRIKVSKLNPFNLKVWLRNAAKTQANELYFSKFDNKYEIKNYGCLVFGQPDTWKGLVRINIIDEGKGLVDVEYDKYRHLGKEEEVKEIIRRAVETLCSRTDFELVEKYEKRSGK